MYSAERCYILYLGRMKFAQAEAECEKHGGVPAQIYDRSQQIALEDFLRPSLQSSDPEFWLGMIHHPTVSITETYSSRTYIARGCRLGLFRFGQCSGWTLMDVGVQSTESAMCHLCYMTFPLIIILS